MLWYKFPRSVPKKRKGEYMAKSRKARPTVAGLLVRYAPDGTLLLGYHRSVKAGLNHFTTVGGEVESAESDEKAIARELLEEYAYPSLDAIQIIDLQFSDTYERRGALKNYRWFLIIDHHRGDVTRVNPDSEEVAEIRWHILSLVSQLSRSFSKEKFDMLTRAIEIATAQYPAIMTRRQVA